MFITKRDPVLSGNKGKAFSKLKQEQLKVVNDFLFKMFLGHSYCLRYPEKVQNIRVLHYLSRIRNLFSFFGKLQHSFFV